MDECAFEVTYNIGNIIKLIIMSAKECGKCCRPDFINAKLLITLGKGALVLSIYPWNPNNKQEPLIVGISTQQNFVLYQMSKLVIQTYPLNVKLSVTECEWIYELPRILVTGDGKGRREEEIRKVVLYNAKNTHHIDIIQILRQERKCMATTFSNIIIIIPPTVDGVYTDTQQQTHETWLCRGRLRLRGNT